MILPDNQHDIYSSTADEFLEKLKPKGYSYHEDDILPSWIYRGQADADWDLLPSALRKNASLMSSNISWQKRKRTNHYHYVLDELITTTNFFKLADSIGLFLNVDHRKVRDQLDKWDRDMDDLEDKIQDDWYYWPPKELLPVFAVAQHHGIPTRLLDFTLDPFIAAYFAASTFFADIKHKRGKANQNLVVWMFNEHILKSNISSYPNIKVECVYSSGFGNANLVLQKGLFVLIRQKIKNPKSQITSVPINCYPFGNIKNSKNHWVYPFEKHTLPVSEAGKLLRLLNQNHAVSAERLFEGFDGIVRSLKERNYWK